MDSRTNFIRDFGKVKGRGWLPEIARWVELSERRGVETSVTGHYKIMIKGKTINAEIFVPGGSYGRYTWEIPDYRGASS